jgi:hypothetical protein
VFTRLTSAVLTGCLAVAAAGCGAGHAAGTNSASQPPPSSQATAPTSQATAPTSDETQISDVLTSGSMRAYLKALGPMVKEDVQANAAAHSMAAMTNTGDWRQAAVYADRLANHLTRAHAAVVSVHAGSSLEGSNGSLACVFSVGSRMALHMADDFRTIDTPQAADDLRHRVFALQQQADRCANSWYADISSLAGLLHVPMPAWTDSLMRWD